MTALTPTWIPGDPSVYYWDNGSVREIIYRYGPNFLKPHRTDGPAEIHYHANGVKHMEIWKSEGQIHRLDGPAVIQWHSNGNMSAQTWIQYGKWYRENDLPAHEMYHENGLISSKEWVSNGTTHRDNDPAIIHWDMDGKVILEQFFSNGRVVGTNRP